MANITVGGVTITEAQARAILRTLNPANQAAIDTIPEAQVQTAVNSNGVSGLIIDASNIAQLRTGLKTELQGFAPVEFQASVRGTVTKEIAFKPNETEKTFELPVNVSFTPGIVGNVTFEDGGMNGGKKVVKVKVDPSQVPPTGLIVDLPLTYRGESVAQPGTPDKFEFKVTKQALDTVSATTNDDHVVTITLPKGVTVEDSELNTYNGNNNNKFKIERDGTDKLKFTLKDNAEFDKAETVELNVKIGSVSEKLKVELKPPAAGGNPEPESKWNMWTWIFGGAGILGIIAAIWGASSDSENKTMITGIGAAVTAVASFLLGRKFGGGESASE